MWKWPSWSSKRAAYIRNERLKDEVQRLQKDLDEISQPPRDEDFDRLYEGFNNLKKENEELKNKLRNKIAVTPAARKKNISYFEESPNSGESDNENENEKDDNAEKKKDQPNKVKDNYEKLKNKNNNKKKKKSMKNK